MTYGEYLKIERNDFDQAVVLLNVSRAITDEFPQVSKSNEYQRKNIIREFLKKEMPNERITVIEND